VSLVSRIPQSGRAAPPTVYEAAHA
jgi:hypothetical protein